jgi:glycerol kinase
MLPVVKSCSEIYAETSIPLFDKPLPIAGMAGDQHAATFGQTCFDAGQGKNTYGTGCFMMLNTGECAQTSKHQLLTTVAWQDGAPLADSKGSKNIGLNYALEGSVFIAGDAVRWLRDGLGAIRDFGDIQALAQQVDDNGGVYFVPAFAGLGAPHWDQYARGAMFGLTGGSIRGHIARAVLEGIAFQTVEVFDAMQKDCGIALKELRVDGGAAKNDLLMQIQADLLGVPVLRPRVIETTALGAAYLAGLAVGFWSDKEVLRRHWLLDRQFEPIMSSARRLELLAKWRKAVDRTKNWVDH